jgi:hypothetical protein
MPQEGHGASVAQLHGPERSPGLGLATPGVVDVTLIIVTIAETATTDAIAAIPANTVGTRRHGPPRPHSEQGPLQVRRQRPLHP